MARGIGIIITTIIGIIMIVALIVTGANDSVLQFVGNVGDTIPVFGSFINVLSAFSSKTLADGLGGIFSLALGTLLNCVINNMLDSIFLGSLFAVTGYGVGIRNGEQRWTGVFNVGFTIIVSAVGVILLYLMYTIGDNAHMILTIIGDLGLILLGIGIMLRGRLPMLHITVFLFSVAIGTVEAGCGIAFICTGILLPTMIRNGVPVIGYILWILCLIALAVAVRFINTAKDAMFGRERLFENRDRR